jgi:hypothetical protein
MSTLKISGCMSVVKDMGDLDRDALLERLDQYRADGVPVERAQVMATADTMAELEDERREFMRLLKEQHPDIFTVTAPAEREGGIRKSADRQIDTPEFKKWFGDSKVVDGNGRPLVVYHGTQGDFDTFRDDIEGRAGFYFTSDKAFASSFAEGGGANVMPAYLSISKPADLRRGVPGSVYDALEGQGYSRLVELYESDPQEIWNFFDGDTELSDALKRAGYDGMRLSEPSGRREVYSWVAFRPEQIKSAIGNNGDFAADNPDITKSADRQTDTPEFKRWFADSVMTENGKPGGEPLVLYHGGFDFAQAPDGKAVPKVSGRGSLGVGFYMTPDKDRARGYAEDNSGAVSSLYVRMERPLEIRLSRGQDPMVEALVALGMDRDKAARKVESAYEKYGYVGSEVKSLALNKGYDGLVEYIGNKMSEVVVWNPTQVKSATNNDGGFSWNPDIRRSADRTPLGFYSALARGLQDAPIKSAPAGAWKTAIKGLLNKGAVKADEVEWSGINDWLDLEGQPKPVYESGYGLIDEHQNEDGTWQQVDDLGTYFRTKDEAESAITDELRRASEEWAKKEGVKSRISVESFDNLDLGKTVTPKITKEQVAQYLEQGGVRVEEVVLGETGLDGGTEGFVVGRYGDKEWGIYRVDDGDSADPVGGTFSSRSDAELALEKMQADLPTKYSQYTLPGGENYREVLLTLPIKAEPNDPKPLKIERRDDGAYVLSDKYGPVKTVPTIEEAEAYRDRRSADDAAVLMRRRENEGKLYRSPRWDQPNVLAHIRVNDRTDADGKRVLFVEELQSDWGQEGKKKGFKGDPTYMQGMEGQDEGFVGLNASGVPRAPFVTKTEGWLNLALKRVMVMAAEGGYDKVAFVNGEQSADRYDLSKQVERIDAMSDAARTGETFYNLDISTKDGRDFNRDGLTADQLEEHVGKEMAQKIVESLPSPGMKARFSGLDLKVGGEGMKTFYDTIVPTTLKKLLPKVGGGQMRAVALGGDYSIEERPGSYYAIVENGEQVGGLYDLRVEAEEALAKMSGAQPGFDVTDAMREKVAGGVPLFSPDRAQTQTPEFKKWFEGSKVVNGLGQPRVVYHGTAADVAIFDMGRAGQTYGLKDEQAFFFTGRLETAESAADDATGLPIYAEKYRYKGFGGGREVDTDYDFDDGEAYDSTALYNGGQNVMPAYLALKNPLIIDADEGYGAGSYLESRGELPGALIARAKSEGYDGIIIRGKYRNVERISRVRANSWMSDAEKKKILEGIAREDARKRQTDNYFIAFRPNQIKSAIGNIGAFGQRPVTAEEAARFGMGEMEANFRQYEGDIRFSVDRDYEPERTVKAYKLFRTSPREPGKLFPLFVNADKSVPMGQWLRAEDGPAAAGGKVKSKLGPLAYRPGWHAGDMPVATHIGMKPKPGDNKPTVRNPEQVWAEVEFAADVDWQEEANKRGTNAQGKVVPVKAHITDRVPEGGFYRYKTNPKMTGAWLIGGEMRVNRVLSDADVKRINDKAGVADLPREKPLDLKAMGFAVRKSEDRDGGEITVDFSADKPSRDRAKAWVAKVNEMFPRNPMNGRQRVMMFGEDDMVIFELDDSVTVPGAAEVKWFQAYPLRSGNGTKGMQELQRLAAEDNMPLTLYPWDKGRVSQAALTKFYKKNGFTPIRKGGKDLVWRPEADITKSADRVQASEKRDTSSAERFDPKQIENNRVPDYKSREKLIDMPIGDFLALAEKGEEEAKGRDVKKLLDNGARFSSLPYLNVDSDYRADGHEGRHRARALKAAGYEKMPVILRVAGLRWSEQADPSRFDYVKDWPTELRAQATAENPSFSIPFPVSREDAMTPYRGDIRASEKRDIDSPEFKRWFGDSKVVDAEGRPLVVYHGTHANDSIERFSEDKIGSRTDDGFMGRGFYFGDSTDASSYAGYQPFSDPSRKPSGGSVYPVYLSLQNPLVLFGRRVGERVKRMPDRGVLARDAAGLPRSASAAELRAKLEGMGHGGVIYTDELGTQEYVAFRPEQIKSAIGNSGAFDPANPDITKSADRTQADTPEFKAWFGDSKVVDENGDPLVVYHGSKNPSITRFDFKPRLWEGLKSAPSKQRPGWKELRGTEKLSGNEHLLAMWLEAGDKVVVNYASGMEVLDKRGRPAEAVVRSLMNPREPISDRVAAGHRAIFFAEDIEYTGFYSVWGKRETGEAPVTYPVYLRVESPVTPESWPDFEPFYNKATGGDRRKFDLAKTAFMNERWEAFEAYPGFIEYAISKGYDGYSMIEGGASVFGGSPVTERAPGGKRTWAVFRPTQIKSAIGNSGTFDPSSPDITKSADRPWFDDLSELKISTNYQLGDLLKTSKKLNWWDRSVGTQYNIAQKHPQFKRVFDAVQRFINDVSAYATRAADLAPSILPKLETLKDVARSPLSAEDVKALRDPIFGGTLKYTRDDEGNVIETDDVSTAGVVFTNDELRELFGLNDRQVKLYREFRRATNKSLTDLAVSDMLRYLGTDGAGVRQRALEATNLDGALDAMVAHLDQLIEQQPQRAKVLEDSKRAIKEKAGQAIGLMARGYAPLSRFGQFTVYAVSKDGEQLYFSMFENERDANKMAREMREQYPDATVTTGTMSQESYKLFSGVTPETLALFGESLGLEESGVDAKSEVFQAYLKMAKTNRSAMKRLIQRKGIDGFSEDAGRVLAGFVYSNARQISTNLHAGEISRSAAAVTDGDVKDAAIRLVDYIQNPQEEAQALRGLLFTQFIGGSIASALVNMTQPFTMTLPYLTQFDGTVGASKRMADAVRLVSRGIRNDDDLQAALKRGEELGIVSPQEVHQLMAQAQGRGSLQSGDGTKAGDAAAKVNNSMAKLGLVWGKLFSAAEQFNRRVTFIAAYKLARDQGMPDPMAFAEQAIAETQGVYNKGNKPKWARGAVGGTLFTFKQYSIAYVEFLRRMWGNGPEGKKAVGLALGVLFLTAGMSGLPGADDLDDVIDGFMQRVLGRSFDSKQAKKEFFASILGQSGAEFVMSGLSGLPGMPIDFSGRMGLGNLFPGTGTLTKKTDYGRDFLEVVGPAGTLFANAGTALASLAQGEVKKAAEVLAPVAAQNALKAVDMAQMGYYRDMKGRKVVDTDGWDALAKSIGFQPRAVAQVQGATMTQANLVGQNKLRETEIADKWARGRIERKPDLIQEAKDELADWNRKNPESKIRIDEAQINKRVQEANKTKAQRIAATAPKEIRNAVKKQLESEGAQ